MIFRALAAGALAAALAVPCAAPGLRAQTADPGAAQADDRIDALLKAADTAVAAGRFDDLAVAAEQAVSLARGQADRRRTAEALFRLGEARFFQSRNREARELHDQVRQIAAEIGDRTLLARALNAIGLELRETGEYDAALDYLSRALEAHRAAGNRVEQARVLRNIAVLYWQLGDLARAQSTGRDAIDVAHAIGDQTLECVALQAYGGIVADGGRPREAIEIDRRALAIARALKVPALLIELSVTTAEASALAGDLHAALDMYRRGLDEAEQARYVVGQAVAVTGIGDTYRRMGKPDEALPYLRRARTMFASLGGTTHLNNAIATEVALGRALRDAGRRDEALATFESAMRLVDRMRAAAVPTETTTASVNAARADVFGDAAGLLVDLHRSEDAFAVSERYRARAFLDVLADAHGRDDEEPGDRSRDSELLAQATRLQNELWRPDLTAGRRRELDASLAAVDDKFERLAGERRRQNPQYSVHDPRPLGVAGVRQQLLDRDTVLIEYMLGASRSFVWAVSSTAVRTATLPGREALEPRVSAYRALLATRVSTLTVDAALREYRRASADLFAAVVEPIAPAIASAKRLIIVADGPLAYLPFETLSARADSDSPPLVERYDISYAPSASALQAIVEATAERPARSRDLLAVGDPLYGAVSSRGHRTDARDAPLGLDLTPLPFTRDEVREIGALFPGNRRTLLLGADAREERVKAAALADYRYLHFATHGLLDARNPARSGLVLSHPARAIDDGVLQTREIMTLRLDADLVTLSACETGLGRLVDGEGVIGLTRAFFYAGARSVVVSLWDVNDRATAALMRRFYAELGRGTPRDAALRAAKLSLARGNRRLWRHPYFWAPFVLTGSAR